MFVCLFVLPPTLPPPPFQFHFLCTLVLMALPPGKGKKETGKKHKADPSLMIRFSVAPDQISPANEGSFLTRPGRSLHHPITASPHHCITVFLLFYASFLFFNTFACSTAGVLIYPPPPPPLHPINKQRTKKAASTCPRTAAERKTLQNNEVRCRRHRHTQLMMKQKKVPDFQRRGGSSGSREERLKALFLTAVACSRQQPGPRALSSPR